jgi:hypothetical protein
MTTMLWALLSLINNQLSLSLSLSVCLSVCLCEAIVMAEETSPLLHYLKRPNPKVDSTWSLRDGKSGSKSRGRGGPHDSLHLRGVVEWEDMEWKALKPLFDDILSKRVSSTPRLEDFLGIPSHLKEISDENSLEALLIRWTYPVVCTALSIAQRYAKAPGLIDTSDYPDEISMARGGQAWIPSGKNLTPDWAGILLSCPENNQPGKLNGKLNNTRHYLNVLPGDTKLSTKFKSEWGWRDQRFKDPIIQVFTYCRRAKVRYGYIITQDELVVLRLFHGDKENPNTLTRGPKPSLYVEYKSIPWANNLGDELTINLTLWCLHMLAAGRRPICERKALGSEYPAPARSTQGRAAEPACSDVSASESSSERDPVEYSFNKRRRLEDTESEASKAPGKKRRAER